MHIVLWVLAIIGSLYCIGGTWYTIHVIRDETINVTHWFGWIIGFILWPLCYAIVATINGMLM